MLTVNRYAALVRHRSTLARIVAVLDIDADVLDYDIDDTRGAGVVVWIETVGDAQAAWVRIVESAALLG